MIGQLKRCTYSSHIGNKIEILIPAKKYILNNKKY